MKVGGAEVGVCDDLLGQSDSKRTSVMEGSSVMSVNEEDQSKRT